MEKSQFKQSCFQWRVKDVFGKGKGGRARLDFKLAGWPLKIASTARGRVLYSTYIIGRTGQVSSAFGFEPSCQLEVSLRKER